MRARNALSVLYEECEMRYDSSILLASVLFFQIPVVLPYSYKLLPGLAAVGRVPPNIICAGVRVCVCACVCACVLFLTIF